MKKLSEREGLKQTDHPRCDWVCLVQGCNERCQGVLGHAGSHQCPVHHRWTSWRPLDSRVLVVAKQGGHPGEWTAYIGAVPGKSHKDEWQSVAEWGSKLSRELAELLFPSVGRRLKYVG